MLLGRQIKVIQGSNFGLGGQLALYPRLSARVGSALSARSALSLRPRMFANTSGPQATGGHIEGES